jgi:serine/threonine-protein kinase GIN4
VPVEVDEPQARIWFKFLLSGVEFLHKRGVAHNDIKYASFSFFLLLSLKQAIVRPANILISHKSVPVLVDFGFAERYDPDSSKAFLSNLSYGTPEYLSPERARGQLHDTRKSDIWSLGITFFEILVGRTPFEESDKDEFVTKDDLQKYWACTVRGKWMGSWKMSRGMESLLRRMLAPNADIRCNTSQAIADEYWQDTQERKPGHGMNFRYSQSARR